MSLEFKKILCPVDLSSFSLDALRLAIKIAEASHATLDILHVIHNPFDEIYMTALTQTDPALMEMYANEPQRRARILRATEEHAEVLLKQFCRETVENYSMIRYHVRRGDPFENILEGAQDFLTDLIVLATHGRTGITRLVIGNVAEKIVRHAPCPVLTVKPHVTGRSPGEPA
ncbi:MAG TPA: universal stress protein [Candidatus Binatia bacterium]|nr:universal stress protein [Candidatus Binatia bacterium]